MNPVAVFLYALLWIALVIGCGRGIRLPGVSWFEISREMRGTSKKARGRMQQTKRRR